MEIEEFLKLVRSRRSMRQLKPDPIPDEYVPKILEAGRWAMSGANGQPWEFVVVRDPELREKVVNAWFEARGEMNAIEQTRLKDLQHRQFIREQTLPGWKDAPVIIVVIGDRRTLQATVLSTHFIPGEGGGGLYYKNMANATQNLHLAAHALGLGSAWISLNRLSSHAIAEILGIPPVFDLHTLVPIGYPAYKSKPPYRRKLEEIVHYDRYDKSKYRTGEDVVNFLRELRQHTSGPYAQEFSD
ncbi:MAG: nitroreductase family protein [Chloroflexota bacterium]